MNQAARRSKEVLDIIDDKPFNWQVFSVAASGFLASSYSLFATNVIKPALYFVYPPCGRLGPDAGLAIDEVTLVGTAAGMLLAGHFADLWGRKKLYGLELAILLVATAGVMQTSEGFLLENPDGTYRHSIDFYSAIVWWRFFLGIGIGAEYPLSAVIAAEWTSTASRGRMLAGVYAMQAAARLLAPLTGLAALRIASWRSGLTPDSPDDDLSRLVIDVVWRAVTGIAIIPAIFAVILRLTIPETPRYYADIRKDTAKAIQKCKKLFKHQEHSSADATVVVPETPAGKPVGEEQGGWYRGIWRYTFNKKTRIWLHLTLISSLWFIMDIAWYGLSTESPTALSTLWHDPSRPVVSRASPSLAIICPDSDDWRTDPGNPSISSVLQANAIRSMIVVSIGSILGNLALLLLIDRFRRRLILVTTFVLLALLFAFVGGTLLTAAKGGKSHLVTTVFFGIIHFFFTVGPKTVILVLAVELFPTAYRGTMVRNPCACFIHCCQPISDYIFIQYGISAAVGKLGAILIRGIIGGTGNGEYALAHRLLGFVGLMLIAALVSSRLPDVQHMPRIAGDPDAEGQDGNPSDHQGSISEQRRRLQVKRKRWGGFFQKIDNKTLEEIPPPFPEEEGEKASSATDEPGGNGQTSLVGVQASRGGGAATAAVL